MANDKIYIHELIEIIGHNRPKYMHHMTAVWAPVRRDHEQQCLGVWAEVGTTGNWPRTVNIWEQDGWEGQCRVDNAHQHGIDPTANIAGHETDEQAYTATDRQR